MWAEMNLYHNAEVAKQILVDYEDSIAQAEFLRKKERGEVESNLFKKIFQKGG